MKFGRLVHKIGSVAFHSSTTVQIWICLYWEIILLKFLYSFNKNHTKCSNHCNIANVVSYTKHGVSITPCKTQIYEKILSTGWYWKKCWKKSNTDLLKKVQYRPVDKNLRKGENVLLCKSIFEANILIYYLIPILFYFYYKTGSYSVSKPKFFGKPVLIIKILWISQNFHS